jgi:hypothetical protein
MLKQAHAAREGFRGAARTAAAGCKPEAVEDFGDEVMDGLLGIAHAVQHCHAGLAGAREARARDAGLPQDAHRGLAHLATNMHV